MKKVEIEICEKQVKCDFYGCPNKAKYSFKTGRLIGSKMHFCNECMKEMYESIGNLLVPKSPKTPFKEKRRK